jgi:hypothetical protein
METKTRELFPNSTAGSEGLEFVFWTQSILKFEIRSSSATADPPLAENPKQIRITKYRNSKLRRLSKSKID